MLLTAVFGGEIQMWAMMNIHCMISARSIFRENSYLTNKVKKSCKVFTECLEIWIIDVANRYSCSYYHISRQYIS